MAAAARIKIEGTISGTPVGGRTIGPLVVISAAANGEVQHVVLGDGPNVITVPTVPATSGCIIKLPDTNTMLTTLKGLPEDLQGPGDVGVAIGKTSTILLNWDSAAAPVSFVLSSAGAQTALITEIIFF